MVSGGESLEIVLHDRDGSAVTVRSFVFGRTGVQVADERFTFEEWEQAVGVAVRVQEGAQWWIGDLLTIGEYRYGEKYSQAVDAMDYDVHTLMNIASVAKRVPPQNRRAELSWSHHRVVASLEPAIQKALLDKAVENGWTTRVLEDAVRAYKAALPASEGGKSHRAVRISSAPDSDPADTTPEAEDVPEEARGYDPDEDGPDLVSELERTARELDEAKATLAAIQEGTVEAELVALKQRYAQLEGRLQAAIAERDAAVQQAKVYGYILGKLRKLLGVETNTEIEAAIRDLLERAGR